MLYESLAQCYLMRDEADDVGLADADDGEGELHEVALECLPSGVVVHMLEEDGSLSTKIYNPELPAGQVWINPRGTDHQNEEFTRHTLPLAIAGPMTSNGCQGRSTEHVVVNLTRPSHMTKGAAQRNTGESLQARAACST